MPRRHDEPQIATDLFVLARAGASGAVQVTGDPGGTIYLNDGHLTFAESAAIPDLASRLIGSGRLSAEQWELLQAAASPHHRHSSLLVEQRFLTEEDLRAVLRSIVLDAVIVLLEKPAGPAAAGLRFVPRARPWIGSPLSLDAESVRAEARWRAELLARHEISLESRPKLSDLRRPWGTISREHWPIACKIDGVSTVRELAWRNGLSLYDTIDGIAEFVRAGFCTLLPAEPPEHTEHAENPVRPDAHNRPTPNPRDPATLLSAPTPGEESAPAHPVDDAAPSFSPASFAAAAEPLPRRRAAGTVPHDLPLRPRDDGVPLFTPPHPELLSSLLEGLRQMDD